VSARGSRAWPAADEQPRELAHVNPEGNADTERAFRTVKEDLLWLREWTSLFESEQALSAWIYWYNTRYLLLALGHRTASGVELDHLASHTTQFAVAWEKGSTTRYWQVR